MHSPGFETEIRARAFVFLRNAVERYGDVLPWQVLTREFSYEGTAIPLIGVSGIWKPRVFSKVPFSITTTHDSPGRQAPYDDALDAQGRLSYRYRGSDPMHRDNVGLRLAMSGGVPLAYFFGINRGEYLATWPVYVVEDHPTSMTFSIAIDDRVAPVAPQGAGTGMAAEARREYVTAITLRRLHQQKFRARVLHAYRNCCAICRLKHVDLLDAAHIIPDSDPRGAPVVPNGLSLCKIHHAAFDRHILGIAPSLTVEIREDVLREVDGPMLRYGLQEMNGARIILPRGAEMRPNPDLIAARYEMFIATRP